jgi:hypothetical protein
MGQIIPIKRNSSAIQSSTVCLALIQALRTISPHVGEYHLFRVRQCLLVPVNAIHVAGKPTSGHLTSDSQSPLLIYYLIFPTAPWLQRP